MHRLHSTRRIRHREGAPLSWRPSADAVAGGAPVKLGALCPRSGRGRGGCSMASQDIALMAHLLRRAGFGATRDELERYLAQGYQATVEELLHPEEAPPALEDEDLIRRYHVDENSLMLIDSCQTYW